MSKTIPTPDLSGAVWRKSARSGNNGGCVEMASVDDSIAVRDSKNPQGGVLVFSRNEWGAFVDGAKSGEFDA